jgi:tetratricopeptide (TPR) repeat protein
MTSAESEIETLWREAERLYAAGPTREALQALAALTGRLAPSASDAIAVKARETAMACAQALEDWPALEILATAAIAAAPENDRGASALQLALQRQGRGAEAPRKLKKARRAALNLRADPLYETARQLQSQGLPEDALAALLGMLSLFPPDSDDPRVRKAALAGLDCARALARWPQLEALARRLIGAFPDSPEGGAALAEALAAQGKAGAAVQAVNDARLAAESDRAGTLHARALNLRDRGRLADALRALEELLSHYPESSADPWVERALSEADALSRRLADTSAMQRLASRWESLAAAGGADASRARGVHLRSAAAEPQLTILTVVLEQHYGYIPHQLRLIEAMNPGTPFRLIVVDNSGAGPPGLRVDDARCQVIPGVDADASLPEHGRGSYHHAAALNMALAQVSSPWLLVLDPDYFVTYRNWIAEVRDHMVRRRLALFGAPWHYAWNRKWRYFPCVHFLMIDLARAPLGELDFTPALLGDAESSSSPFHKWMREHAPFLRNRLLLESRRDTGWRLHRRFRRTRAAEATLPVVDTRTEFRGPPHMETPLGRWLEQRLPRRVSFLPVAGSYVEADQAAAFRHPAIRSLAPERFVWRGAPFAVHLRGHMREDMRTSANPAFKERTAIRELMDAVAGTGAWTEWAFGGTSESGGELDARGAPG